MIKVRKYNIFYYKKYIKTKDKNVFKIVLCATYVCNDIQLRKKIHFKFSIPFQSIEMFM